MRLIDADKFKQEVSVICIRFNLSIEKIATMFEIIDAQPIAYDVDEVISQLENKMFSAECYNDNFNGCEINNLLCMGDVYEIVKGAVKDD